MSKRIVPLSDRQVKNAKAGEKDFCLFDGFGLFLLVTTTGGKLWRFKYFLNGKAVQMAWGTYPELTLNEAREKWCQTCGARCRLSAFPGDSRRCRDRCRPTSS